MADVDTFSKVLATWEPINTIHIDKQTHAKYLLSLRVPKGSRDRHKASASASAAAPTLSTLEDDLGDNFPGDEMHRNYLVLVYTDCQSVFYRSVLDFARVKQPKSLDWHKYFLCLREALGRSENIDVQRHASRERVRLAVAMPHVALEPEEYELEAVSDAEERAKQMASLTFDMAVQMELMKARDHKRLQGLEQELRHEKAKVAALQSKLSLYGGVPPPLDTGPASQSANASSAETKKRKAPKSLFNPGANMRAPKGARIGK